MTERARTALTVLGAAALWAGCTPAYYKADADREVYRILSSRQALASGAQRGFTIESSGETASERLLETHPGATPPREAALTAAELDPANTAGGVPTQPGAMKLALRDALRLAARYSRQYRTEKETLYLAALALTLQRFLWQPKVGAGGTVTGTAEKDTYTEEVDLEGNPVETKVKGLNSVSSKSTLSVSQLLALGGEVSVSLATDLFKYTNVDPSPSAASTLVLEVLQPLWRGAGRLVARESLTQAERDVVYAIRAFARFRRGFCVTVTSSYYRVLQQRDAVANQWQNWDRIRQSRERTEAMAKAGRLPEFQVDQARQDELSARDSWLRALQQYQQQLDQFKIDLALPTDTLVELDPGEIERLREGGLHRVELSLDRIAEIALRDRLDLLTSRDAVADAERKVELARNGLGPQVDLRLTGTVASAADNRPLKLPFHRGTYSAALDVDLPLQRTEERNAYRSSFISLERARRAFQELYDQVTFSVRQDWRNLQEAAQSYEIQVAAVELAQRRVESTSLLLQRGDAQPRDVLDANASLVAAQNALTRTLVDHTLARLALWRDSELLRVSEDGICQEVTDVQE